MLKAKAMVPCYKDCPALLQARTQHHEAPAADAPKASRHKLRHGVARSAPPLIFFMLYFCNIFFIKKFVVGVCNKVATLSVLQLDIASRKHPNAIAATYSLLLERRPHECCNGDRRCSILACNVAKPTMQTLQGRSVMLHAGRGDSTMSVVVVFFLLV